MKPSGEKSWVLHFRRVVSAVLVVVIVALFLMKQAGAIEAPTAYYRAQQLKAQLDANPQAVSAQKKAQFDAQYADISGRFDAICDRSLPLKAAQDSHEKDAAAAKKEMADFYASCANASTPSEVERCRSWEARLKAWADRIHENKIRLEKEIGGLENEIRIFNAEVERDFNRPLELALDPRKQTWIFTGTDANGNEQKADVIVNADGTFSGSGWQSKNPSCAPPYEYTALLFYGKFDGAHVVLNINAKGCGPKGNEKVSISAYGEGAADQDFPDAKAIHDGTVKGVAQSPLGKTQITMKWEGERIMPQK